MKKSSIVVVIAVLGMLTTIAILLLFKVDSRDFVLGLSSDYWVGFVGSAGVGVMLVLLSMHYSKLKRSE